jgi:hypothetical protein
MSNRFPFDWKLGNRLASHNRKRSGARGHIFVNKVTPLAADTDGILAAVTLTTAKDVASGWVSGIQAKLAACPQLVTIKGTKAGATLTGDVVITGTDICGNAIEDTIALNDDTVVAGVYAFASVTNVHFPAKATTADTVEVGFTKAYGVPFLAAEVLGALVKLSDGSADTGTLALDASDVGKSIYTPSATPNGSKVHTLSLLVADL